MPLSVYCAECKKSYKLGDKAAGRRVRCPAGHILQVPMPAASETSAEPEPDAAPDEPLQMPPSRNVPHRFLILGGLVALGLLAITVMALLSSGKDKPNPGSGAASEPGSDRSQATDPGASNPNSTGSEESADPPGPGLAGVDRLDKLATALPAAAASEPPTPEVWDGHTSDVRGVAFTDDGRFVVSVSGDVTVTTEGARKPPDNSIRLWDARRGKQIHSVEGFSEALDGVSVSPGGRFAIFGCGGHWEDGKWTDARDHHIRMMDLQEKKYVARGASLTDPAEDRDEPGRARFQGLESSVFCTAYSPDRRLAAAADNGGHLRIWSTDTGKAISSIEVEPLATEWVHGIVSLHFTPDRRYLVAAAYLTVRVFDVNTRSQVGCLQSHQDQIWSVAVGRGKDGRTLALSGGGGRQRQDGKGHELGALDYAIRLWSIPEGQLQRQFAGHEGPVMALAFCPNGRHFISAGMDQTVRLWDLESGKQIRLLGRHTAPVRSVAVAPDGRSAVSGGDDHKVRFWRLPASAEELVRVLEANEVLNVGRALKDLDVMGQEARIATLPLLAFLRTSPAQLVQPVIAALQQLGGLDRKHAPALGTLLDHSDAAVRSFALKALKALGPDAREALPKLLEMLARGREDEAEQSLAIVVRLGGCDRTHTRWLAALVERPSPAIRSFACDELMKLGASADEALPTLRNLLQKTEDVSLLISLVGLLGKMHDSSPEGLALLTTRGLKHQDAGVRQQTVKALIQIGGDAFDRDRFVDLLRRDPSPQVREEVERGLRQKLDSAGVKDLPIVRAMLKTDEAAPVQLLALDLVIRLGPDAGEAAVQVGELLQSGDATVQLRALLALQALGKTARPASPALVKALETNKIQQKRQAAVLLARLEPSDRKVLKLVLPILIDGLKPEEGRPDTEKEQVLQALEAIGAPAGDALVDALEMARGKGAGLANHRKVLLQAIEKLGKKAFSEENVLRVRVFTVKDNEVYQDVRDAAARALGAMRK
jgi:WD40 repeat protein